LSNIIYQDGRQETLKDLKLIPGKNIWESKKTEAKYPLIWEIKIPEKKIDLKVSALVKDQEIIFGSINYWEGPLSVVGTINGKEVLGKGFMELVGYNSNYSNIDYIKNELEKVAGYLLASPRKKLGKILQSLR
jgi:predicted secreted hydrolase